MKRVLAWFATAIILAGLAIYQYSDSNTDTVTHAATSFKPKAGYEAATFELPDLNDQLVSVGGSMDKLILVNFWASWCGPCELEAPDLKRLHDNYQDQMIIYGVNATHYDRERGAREFVQRYEFEFPIVMDREGKVTDKYLVNNFPTSFLIDRDGVIRERVNGVITYEDWERLIQKWS